MMDFGNKATDIISFISQLKCSRQESYPFEFILPLITLYYFWFFVFTFHYDLHTNICINFSSFHSVHVIQSFHSVHGCNFFKS